MADNILQVERVEKTHLIIQRVCVYFETDSCPLILYSFFFNDTATTEIYTLSLHDALPICEQLVIEHCRGYPLSGEFVRIDHCYDVPRILHCHVNPANMRFFASGFSKRVIDAVVARGTFAYAIDHTDDAQVIDVFTFGTGGGIRLGPASYGQLTNFYFDCVTVGIHKLGDRDFNRNWQIAQGSITANAGRRLADVHPVIIEGQGHTAMTNVEAFSGDNPVVTNFGKSQDF